MRAVLLTGGTGFVGSRLLPRLTHAGYHVAALARRDQPAIPGVDWITGDLSAYGGETLPQDISVLIDLAASIPTAGVADDATQFYKNIEGHIELASRLPGLAQIVYASTIDVYGPLQSDAFGEDDPPNPRTCYAAGKLALEHLYRIFATRARICLTTLRLSQVYGRGDVGSKIIPLFIRSIQEGREIILTNDGTARRKYLHVDDACSAILRALDARKDGTYNIAGPAISSIKETLQCIEQAIGRRARTLTVAGAHVDLIMETSRAADELGFVAQVPLPDGIARSI